MGGLLVSWMVGGRVYCSVRLVLVSGLRVMVLVWLSVGVVVIPVGALFLGLFFEPGLFEPVVVFGGGDGLSVAFV